MFEIETALVTGNNTIGSKAVAAIGIASSIHHIAIQLVVARTFLPSSLRSLKEINCITIKDNGPNKSPKRCFENIISCCLKYGHSKLTNHSHFSTILKKNIHLILYQDNIKKTALTTVLHFQIQMKYLKF